MSPKKPTPRPSGEEITAILGPKCSECGWRRGAHRPPLADVPACGSWVRGGQNREEETP